MRNRAANLLWMVGASLIAGCFPLGPSDPHVMSYGTGSDGHLEHGVPMAERGRGFVRARPGEATRYGTEELVGAIARAAGAVADAYPGTAPLRVGDLSFARGGKHPRHHSHRTGRDVDLIYYVRDAEGGSVGGRGWLAFDRFGVALDREEPGSEVALRQIYFFDEARNWALVRSLLLDREADVQWIFCSRGVKARLLRYAAAHEPDREVLFRASWVLHQPSHGNPHADHFHVRVACTAAQRALGCYDDGPIWPWFRDSAEKPGDAPGEALTDEVLVEALLGDADARLASR